MIHFCNFIRDASAPLQWMRFSQCVELLMKLAPSRKFSVRLHFNFIAAVFDCDCFLDYAYGGTIDWVLGVLGKQAYAFELPGGGLGGFNPPASAIEPVNAETWEAYKVFAQNIPPP